jgi:hypothetical protein
LIIHAYNLAIMSVSLKRINSCSPSLTLAPPNSGNNTVSPTLTVSGTIFPFVSWAPGPVYSTTP